MALTQRQRGIRKGVSAVATTFAVFMTGLLTWLGISNTQNNPDGPDIHDDDPKGHNLNDELANNADSQFKKENFTDNTVTPNVRDGVKGSDLEKDYSEISYDVKRIQDNLGHNSFRLNVVGKYDVEAAGVTNGNKITKTITSYKDITPEQTEELSGNEQKIVDLISEGNFETENSHQVAAPRQNEAVRSKAEEAGLDEVLQSKGIDFDVPSMYIDFNNDNEYLTSYQETEDGKTYAYCSVPVKDENGASGSLVIKNPEEIKTAADEEAFMTDITKGNLASYAVDEDKSVEGFQYEQDRTVLHNAGVIETTLEDNEYKNTFISNKTLNQQQEQQKQTQEQNQAPRR